MEEIVKPLRVALQSIDILSDAFLSISKMFEESDNYAQSIETSDEFLRLRLKLAFQSGWMAALNCMLNNKKEK